MVYPANAWLKSDKIIKSQYALFSQREHQQKHASHFLHDHLHKETLSPPTDSRCVASKQHKKVLALEAPTRELLRGKKTGKGKSVIKNRQDYDSIDIKNG